MSGFSRIFRGRHFMKMVTPNIKRLYVYMSYVDKH